MQQRGTNSKASHSTNFLSVAGATSETCHTYCSREYGLFLRQKLKPAVGKDSKDYTVPRELIKMMNLFKTTKRPTVFDNLERDDIRNAEESVHRKVNRYYKINH
jgi:hypothetical protein